MKRVSKVYYPNTNYGSEAGIAVLCEGVGSG